MISFTSKFFLNNSLPFNSLKPVKCSNYIQQYSDVRKTVGQDFTVEPSNE